MAGKEQHSMTVVSSTLPQGIGLIEVAGSLLGGEEIEQLRSAVSEFVDREQSRLIIDVTGVTYLNSSAVGVLISALIAYMRQGWKIKLCGVSKAVYSILAITKLNLIFDRYDTREEAILSFR